MTKFLRGTALALVLSSLSLPAIADDATDARLLLVEAIRAYQAAEEMSDPAERLAALEDAIAALARIEADYVTTDTGINLISGGTFGAFDPSALRAEYETAQRDAALASCETTYSAPCAYAMRNEAIASVEGITVEDLLDQAGAPDRIRFLLASGAEPSEIAELLASLPVQDPWDTVRTLTEFYYLGHSVEMLDVFERLPASHPLRGEYPDRRAFVESLHDMVDGRNAVQGPTRRAALQRLIDANEPGLERTILAKGSPEQVEWLLTMSPDAEAAVSDWLARGWVSPGFDGAAYVAAALDKAGRPDLALPLIVNERGFSNEHVTYMAPRLLTPETLARYVEAALPRIEVTRHATSLVWDTVAALPASLLASTLETIDAAPGVLADLVETNEYAARFAGIEVGRDDAAERQGKLRMVEARFPGTFNAADLRAFREGVAIGSMTATDPSGDAFEAVLAGLSRRDKLTVLTFAAEELVNQGRLEDALAGIGASGALEGRIDDIRAAANLAAAVGNLSWLASALSREKLDMFQGGFVLESYKRYLTAAREHGYDLSGAADQVADLMLATEDEYAWSQIVREIAMADRPDYEGGGDIVFDAAMKLNGERRIYALVSAYEAATAYRE